MKKYARLVSAIALMLAVIICFSGCGVIDHARSLVKEDENGGNNKTTATSEGANDTTNTNNTTNVATAPGNLDSTTPSTSDTSTTVTLPDTNLPAQGQTGNNGDTNNDNNVNTDTSGPSDDKDYSKEELESLTVHDLQNLLFSTTNPNTAGKILEIAGFEYDAEQCVYYSQMNPLQRKFGFNFVYDMAAPLAMMYYDTKRIEFEYGGKEWMIQLWKGQYGATAGAEIGLYSRDPEKVMQYDCADDEELITMQFDFYNMGEYVFSRGPEKHWWLTGFKVFHIGIPSFITMDMMLDFEDNFMANAFERSLKKVAAESFMDPITYERKGSAFYIEW